MFGPTWPNDRAHKGRTTYRDIGGPNGLLANLQEFHGNSMRAERNETDGVYYVVSYTTVIAEVTLRTGAIWIDRRKYSQTTSRHQGLCRTWLATNYTPEDA